jgi:hypothetical protein
MIWSEQMRDEAFLIVGKIPPLSWETIAGLFRPEDGYSGALFPERFQQIATRQTSSLWRFLMRQALL